MSDAPIYVFARTKEPVASSAAEFVDLAYGVMDVGRCTKLRLLSFGSPRFCWRDGVALAVQTSESIADIRDELLPVLNGYRSWTLYRSTSEFFESSSSGPLAECKWALQTNPLSFCCLLAKQDNFAFGSAIDEAVRMMRNSVPYRVFEFSDGAIVAVSPRDPPSITYRRSERQLSKLFDRWAFIYPDGQLPSEGIAQWVGVEAMWEDREDELAP
jgi:hypothetical protein